MSNPPVANATSPANQAVFDFEANRPMISIIIPTFGEAANLALLIPQIADLLEKNHQSGEIIVVDDNSPDDTIEVCRQLATMYPLKLLVRIDERGLSSAVLHGLRNARGDILVVMDADLSHPSDKILELAAPLERGTADFVIGSRYVSGGHVEEGWGLLRWLNSLAATILARPLTSAKDPLAGFFALRRQTYSMGTEFDPVGYKIGLELIVKCRCQHVREIAITFRNRLHGESKLTLCEQLNYLRHLWRLYAFKKRTSSPPRQYAVSGLMSALVDLATFMIALIAIPLPPARAVAISISLVLSYGCFRRPFSATEYQKSAVAHFLLFCLAQAPGAVANWLLSIWLFRELGSQPSSPLLAGLAGIAIGAIINYPLATRFISSRA